MLKSIEESAKALLPFFYFFTKNFSTMKKYLWASPHKPTQDIVASLDGDIVFLKDVNPALYNRLIDSPTDTMDLLHLAQDLFRFANPIIYDAVLQPAGSPAFQFCLGALSCELANDQFNGSFPVAVWYAHSDRVSVDVPQDDGTVVKTSVFKFKTWVKV